MGSVHREYRSTDIQGDYADMAKAFGGYGERITDPNDIVAALKRGIEATGNGQAASLSLLPVRSWICSLHYSSYGK